MNSKKKKLTWVDWAILLMAVTLLLWGWSIIRNYSDQKEEPLEFSYLICFSYVNFSCENPAKFIKDRIKHGDAVTTANGTAVLGTVSKIETVSCVAPLAQKNGIVFANIPYRVNVYVEINATGTCKPGEGVRVSGIRIAAGSTGDFRIGGYLAPRADVVRVTEEGFYSETKKPKAD